jgi:hypothetical protein
MIADIEAQLTVLLEVPRSLSAASVEAGSA